MNKLKKHTVHRVAWLQVFFFRTQAKDLALSVEFQCCHADIDCAYIIFDNGTVAIQFCTSSNHRLESAGLNALEELLFR